MPFSSKFSATVRAVIVAGMLSIAAAGPTAAQDIFGLNEAFDNFLDGVIAGSGMDPNSDAAEAAKDYGRGALTGTADPDSVAEHAVSGNGTSSPGNAPAVSVTALCDRILMPEDFECTPTGDGRVRVAARAPGDASASPPQREARNPAHDLGPYSGPPETERQACLSGDLIACGDLAARLSESDGVAQDYAGRLALAGFACDDGDPGSCSILGYSFDFGLGVAEDDVRAVELYDKACLGGSMMGCNNLGAMFNAGLGVAKDLERALELYELSCDGGFMSGCNNLGSMLNNGSGIAEDDARATKLFARACRGGVQKACENLEIMR